MRGSTLRVEALAQPVPVQGEAMPHRGRSYRGKLKAAQIITSPAPIFAPMEDADLVRRLRRLRRTVDMLQTDLRCGRLNDSLLAEIESHMEQGISLEPRCGHVRARVDALREGTFTPRPELLADTIRAGDNLKDAIEALVSGMR